MIERNLEGYYQGEFTEKKIKNFPSVTTIIKDAFNPYENVPLYLLDKAATYGKAVHKTLELDNLEKLNEKTLDENLIKPLEAWRECKKQNKVEVIDTEINVVSFKNRYAGMVDCFAFVNGKYSLIDYKTRKINNLIDPLQLSAYKDAFNENSKDKIKDLYIFTVDIDGRWKLIKINDHNYHFNIFKCALALYNYKKRGK